MTIYGDLDVSIIDELPPGRKEIKTVHRSEGHRPQVIAFLKQQIEKGRQVFIIFPLIVDDTDAALRALPIERALAGLNLSQDVASASRRFDRRASCTRT